MFIIVAEIQQKVVNVLVLGLFSRGFCGFFTLSRVEKLGWN